MVQTVTGYMAASYGSDAWRATVDAFKCLHILPGEILATPKHKFMCDCLWWTYMNKDRFQNAVKATDFTCQLTDQGRQAIFQRTADEIAEMVIEQVREIWKQENRDEATAAFKYATKQLCAHYLLTKRIMYCDRPWQLVMACQKERQLAALLKSADNYGRDRPNWRRRDYYDQKLKPEAESLLSPLRGIKEFENPEVLKTYLQAAHGVLDLDNPD